MTKKQKNMLARIIVAAVIFVPLFVAEHMGKLNFQFQLPVSFLLYLIAYIIVGWDIVYKAIRNISHGQVFDENFLMCVATFGAFGVMKRPWLLCCFIRWANCSRIMRSIVPDSRLRS